MKIDKAIEILRIIHDDIDVGHVDDDLDALKLGVEALKAIKRVRPTGFGDIDELLPGETEE